MKRIHRDYNYFFCDVHIRFTIENVYVHYKNTGKRFINRKCTIFEKLFDAINELRFFNLLVSLISLH